MRSCRHAALSRYAATVIEDHHELPTPRTTLAAQYVRVPVFRNSCRHLRGDVPLTKLRFRCSPYGTDRTYFVVTSRDNPQPW
jgi:hypothetical protein